MRFDGRQIRFIVPFVTLRPRQLVRLGGRRGSIQLQETALVAEGELLCFTFILGLEWLFRRALSQWTTLTIPYSRIERVQVTRLWPLRLATALVVAVWIGLIVWLWSNVEAIAPVMVIGAAIVVILVYVNVRIRRAVRIQFQSKNRRRLLALVIRPRSLRATFLDLLGKHRMAAQQFQTSTATATAK